MLRQLFAIAVLPFTVTIVVPVWIARRYGVAFAEGRNLGELLLQFAGLEVLCVGLLLFAASLRRFAGEGRGTLAPWDPPRALVVRGPYRYVRNPMVIVSVCQATNVLNSRLAWKPVLPPRFFVTSSTLACCSLDSSGTTCM